MLSYPVYIFRPVIYNKTKCPMSQILFIDNKIQIIKWINKIFFSEFYLWQLLLVLMRCYLLTEMVLLYHLLIGSGISLKFKEDFFSLSLEEKFCIIIILLWHIKTFSFTLGSSGSCYPMNVQRKEKPENLSESIVLYQYVTFFLVIEVKFIYGIQCDEFLYLHTPE